jgi:hypothetical protein
MTYVVCSFHSSFQLINNFFPLKIISGGVVGMGVIKISLLKLADSTYSENRKMICLPEKLRVPFSGQVLIMRGGI